MLNSWSKNTTVCCPIVFPLLGMRLLHAQRRVAVIGCGTAGPAAALNIVRRLGPAWTVEVFDRAKAPAAVGAGIGIQPIGLTALHKLGLLDAIMQHGARIDAIRTWTHEGDPVLDVAYERFDPRLFGLGLHRGALFEALLRACRRSEGISLRFGVEIVEMDQASTDHVVLRDSTGKARGPFDLVVVANGTTSRLRAQLGKPILLAAHLHPHPHPHLTRILTLTQTSHTRPSGTRTGPCLRCCPTTSAPLARRCSKFMLAPAATRPLGSCRPDCHGEEGLTRWAMA